MTESTKGTEYERITGFWKKLNGDCPKCGKYNGWSNKWCQDCGMVVLDND